VEKTGSRDHRRVGGFERSQHKNREGEKGRESRKSAPIPRPNRTLLHPSHLCQLRQIHPIPPQTRRKTNRRTRDRNRIPSSEYTVLDGFGTGERAGALEGDGEGEVVADSGD
jgi:hypothetical protein